jgi:dihydroorotase
MSDLSRRHFLAGSAAAALSGHLANSAFAAMGPADKFDLVIKGGDVLDPSQSLRGKRDIGIRWGVIEAVEAEIPAARASKTIDASGKLVTPGLVDLHCHVYPYGSAIGIPADELVQFQGTTTVVSAGDSGAISWRNRAREFTPSSTSPTMACRLSRSRSSTISTTRRSRPAPWRSPRTRIF